jgi:hypothetical protein
VEAVRKPTRREPAGPLPEQYTLANATPFGGATLIWRFLDKLGFRRLLQTALGPFDKRQSIQVQYTLPEVVEVLVLGRILGIGRIHEFRHLEQDPLLRRLFGWAKLPDMTTLYRDLQRLGQQAVLGALERVGEAVAGWCLGPRVILDLDSTVETVYGRQEGAAVGYNPAKPGRPSYHPQMCFDGVSRTLIRVQLRPGNTVSGSGLCGWFRELLSGQALQGRQIELVRGDRGYGSGEFLDLLESRGLPYIVKLGATQPLRAWALGLAYREIGETAAGDVLEVGSGMYQAAAWGRPRRVVVVRERSREVPPGQLIPLPVISEERFLVTSTDWDAEEVFHSYNQRCTAELNIRTLKEDWGLDEFSSRKFGANAADLLLKGMAYNLLLLMHQYLAPRDRSVVHTAATLRRMWFWLPAVVATHARRYFLRLPRWAEHGDYGQACRALEALAIG